MTAHSAHRSGRIAITLLLAVLAASAAAQSNSTLFGVGGITPAGVRQGVHGSSSFHSAVAALAQIDPITLRKLVACKEGVCQVQFNDSPAELVFPEDLDDVRQNNLDRSQGKWVAILLRGYAQHLLRLSFVKAVQTSTLIPASARPIGLNWLDRSGPMMNAFDRAVRQGLRQGLGQLEQEPLKTLLSAQMQAQDLPASQIEWMTACLGDNNLFVALTRTVYVNAELFIEPQDSGVRALPAELFQALLGRGDSTFVEGDRQLMARLGKLHDGNLAMAAWTREGQMPPSMDEWFVSAHCYTVLDYDSRTSTLRLRNPWAEHPAPDGVFSLPLAEFRAAFSGYSYAAPAGQP